ncbi:MAG: domain S-box protein [Brevundimonas sp.]|nr:domain S-box protein [Brevundimonas sp.]
MTNDVAGVVDALPDLVWTALPDGRFQFVNERWCAYTGMTLADSQDCGWIVAVHPDDLDEVRRRWRALLDGRLPGDFEARLRGVDGSYRWFLFRASAMHDQAGALVRWCGTTLDIEDRKQAVETLKAREADLRSANAQLAEGQRLSRTGTFTADLQIDRHRWSDEYYRIFDIDPATSPSVEAVRQRVHPDDLQRFDFEIQRGVDGGDGDFTFRIVTPSQGLRYLRGVARLMDHIEGRPLFMGTVQDITEAELAQAALTAQGSELRQAYDCLAEAQRLSRTGSFTWDPGQEEHNWSDELRRIFGFNLDVRLSTAMIRRAIHPDDATQVTRVVGRAVQDGEFDLAFRIVATTGEVRHARVVGHRVRHITDRAVFLGALQDVTDSRMAEERLDRARRELAQLARATALNALTASMAHEVNQPLAGIMANASTCLRFLTTDPPNTEGAKATAHRSIRDANWAAEVIKRLQAVFAWRAPTHEVLDVNGAAVEVLALAARELEAAQVVLRSHFAADLPTILGDRIQLQQVILNLTRNAAEAMQAVDDRVRALSISTVRDGPGRIRLCVRDAGPGPQSEALARVVEALSVTMPNRMGSGLSICRSIVEAHGGRIWAGENAGPGLIVCVSLPITPPRSVGPADDDLNPDGPGWTAISRGDGE